MLSRIIKLQKLTNNERVIIKSFRNLGNDFRKTEIVSTDLYSSPRTIADEILSLVNKNFRTQYKSPINLTKHSSNREESKSKLEVILRSYDLLQAVHGLLYRKNKTERSMFYRQYSKIKELETLLLYASSKCYRS